jgi:hypothetical protein
VKAACAVFDYPRASFYRQKDREVFSPAVAAVRHTVCVNGSETPQSIIYWLLFCEGWGLLIQTSVGAGSG